MPNTEVSPEYTGPDFLTSQLPPSSRPGHTACDVGSGEPARKRRFPGKFTLATSAGLLPAVVDMAVTGTPTEGIVVGGLSALAVGVAAVAI
ncbi:hypothetical protein [Prescottella agglutinans]|uniref:hypothetical protein n=1 Tax=Prescottella agglutinans TaxID=1644129 RepID=UPI000FDE867B|nr:hypothetical protein [Prescottella agglutinans]